MLSKNLHSSAVVLILSIMLMFSPFVFAQPGMDDFNQGVNAAKKGDYQSALKFFEKAKKGGLDTPALQFNLGVTYYKLDRLVEAKKAFTGLIRLDNYSQLAYFNLGLIANKQNKKAEAVEAFQRAYKTGKSDKVRALSREALSRLGEKPEKIITPTKKWAGLVTMSYESDSNVALVNDDLAGVTSNSDTSIVLSGFAANWLSGDSHDGLRLFLRGYMQNYSTETNYNYNQFGAGMLKYLQLGSWQTRFGGFWDETYLGGSSYQRILTAEMQSRYNLSASNQLRLRYKFNSIESTDTAYDYLGGSRHQLRAGLRKQYKSARVRAYYELEMNDRKDFDNPLGTTYTFKSYSPTRHTLRLTGWFDLSKEWELRLDARTRSSKYNDEYILASNATEVRKDTQTRLSARLSKEMARDLNLEMGYTVTKNDSTIDEESYDRNQASLGIAWKF